MLQMVTPFMCVRMSQCGEKTMAVAVDWGLSPPLLSGPCTFGVGALDCIRVWVRRHLVHLHTKLCRDKLVIHVMLICGL